MNKLLSFIVFINSIILFFHIVNFEIHNIDVNASPLTKTEFTTHRNIDEELGIVCYTTFIINGIESGLSTSCVSLPSVCDYGERKVSKIGTKVHSWSNYQD